MMKNTNYLSSREAASFASGYLVSVSLQLGLFFMLFLLFLLLLSLLFLFLHEWRIRNQVRGIRKGLIDNLPDIRRSPLCIA